MPLPKKGEAVPISKIKEICELTEIPPGYTGSILRARRHSSTFGDQFLPRNRNHTRPARPRAEHQLLTKDGHSNCFPFVGL